MEYTAILEEGINGWFVAQCANFGGYFTLVLKKFLFLKINYL
jgi:hypothetical protein